MSLKYRDKNGAEVVLAGLTPGGNIEAGAVATRSGAIKCIIAANESKNFAVTFSDALPDADYEVVWDISSAPALASQGSVLISVVGPTKTASGFSFAIWNNSGVASTFDLDWKAFKLYEVADAEQLYSKVQDLESMVPSNASSTNKFSTADDLRTETRTLDRRLDDVEDVIPTSASITNKLVTQSDLSGVEIDKVEDINDVELTNIQDGQTLIWDDENSKWVNGQGGKTYTAGDGIEIDSNDAISVADTYKTIFVGTRAQWDALSATDKIKYQEAHITDDVIGGEVADVVQDGLMSPVTSNAVFDALATKIPQIKTITIDAPKAEGHANFSITIPSNAFIVETVISTSKTSGVSLDVVWTPIVQSSVSASRSYYAFLYTSDMASGTPSRVALGTAVYGRVVYIQF